MRLPALKSREVVIALKAIGFKEARQTGSHLTLTNPTNKRIVMAPMHSRDIKRGLLTAIIKNAGLTRKQFLELV